MLILTHSQVRELLPMRDCMAAMVEALSALASGEGVQPLRGGFLLPDRRGVLAWMPDALAAGEVFGVKVLSVVEDPGALDWVPPLLGATLRNHSLSRAAVEVH